MKNLKEFMYKYFVVIICLILTIGCAQFVPPTGGKKDIIPPNLLKSIPINKTINFKGQTIELYFNELIDATNLRQELLIFPQQEGSYDYKVKTNGIVIKFDKPFKEKTTYTLNFRNGIKDLNEHNNAKNLKLIFSTGTKIDSMSIEGKVTDLFTNKAINEATVALYEINDSLDIRKTKPTYFYKTDTSGFYKFENTKIGKYKMYAYLDKNNNLRYDSKNEPIGFYKDTLKLTKNRTNINFNLYMVDTLRPKVQKTLQRVDEFSVLYNEGLKKIEIKFENKQDTIPYIIETKSIKFYNYPTKTDTIKVNIAVSDSANNILKHTQKVKFKSTDNNVKKKKKEYLKFDTNPKNGEDIENEFTCQFLFDAPIVIFDLDKIKIVSDTVMKEEISNKNFEWNKTKNELYFHKKLSTVKEVKIEVIKGAFINIKGDSSANTILKYKILNPENYGLIEGRVEGKENKIIQLVDENFKTIKEIKSKDKFIFKNIKPGQYFIRVITDTNGNGQWDCGNLTKEIMPEEVYITPNAFNIKANFEITDQVINTKMEKVNSK